MEKAVSVIRSELIALKTCLEKTRALRDAIKSADDANAVKTLVKETENTLSKLGEAANAKENFLKEQKANNIEEYLEAQRLSETGEVVMRLLKQAKTLEKELADEVFKARELLKRSSEFVDFRMNVIASVKADTTYGPPGKSQGDATATKMFEANI